MGDCFHHDLLIECLKDIKEEQRLTRNDIKNLKSHFDKRHDKNIEIINKNKTDIALLKTKQYFIAGVVGMGGGWAQDLLKKIIF